MRGIRETFLLLAALLAACAGGEQRFAAKTHESKRVGVEGDAMALPPQSPSADATVDVTPPVAPSTASVDGKGAATSGATPSPTPTPTPAPASASATESTAHDVWKATSLSGAPSPRSYPAVAWTGTEVFVWGGLSDNLTDGGALYNPTSDTWHAVSSINAPPAAGIYQAVWTGKKVVVWGAVEHNTVSAGGLYDPATDTWTAIAPYSGFIGADFAVWTGAKVFVWNSLKSGQTLAQAAIYDLAANAWTTLSPPAGTASHFSGNESFHWTGKQVITYGGYDTPNAGDAYDMDTGTWSSLPANTLGWGLAVFSPTDVVVCCGVNAAAGKGAALALDASPSTWSAIPDPPAALAVDGRSTAAWTGSEALYWGGALAVNNGYIYSNAGQLYNPATRTWRAMTQKDAPPGRTAHGWLWADKFLFVWGGYNTAQNAVQYMQTGSLYMP